MWPGAASVEEQGRLGSELALGRSHASSIADIDAGVQAPVSQPTGVPTWAAARRAAVMRRAAGTAARRARALL